MIDLIDYIGRCSSRESTYRLADFFNRWWDEYAQHPAEYITPEQYKAVNAIRVCRTAALGIDTYVCPDCGEVREISHSCKNRFCPSCGWRDTLKWAARMKEKLLRVPHRHVVMTLPHNPAGLGEAQQERNTEHSDADFGRHAERLDDAQVRLENRGDCRAAHLWGNKAASCTHPHDYVVGAASTAKVK